MGAFSRTTHSSPVSVGIAERAPVITPVPAFGSSVYRILDVIKEPLLAGVGAARENATVSASQRQLVVSLYIPENWHRFRLANFQIVRGR